MNIFYLDEDPAICATFHADKHVVKMILEYAQLLCTAHHLCGDASDEVRALLYRATHQNHPCALWVRATKAHYEWLYRLFVCLCDEYTHRYGKVHLTDKKLREILKVCPINIDTPFKPPPQVMPELYHHTDSVQAYRAYYRDGKANLLAFTKRLPLSWLDD